MKKCKENGVDIPAKYKIKVSGDGARMTRLTGFIVISFSVLNEGKAALSSKGTWLQLCHAVCLIYLVFIDIY
jgi:hypothetical protein